MQRVMRAAVAGAGVYGATIAIELARHGYSVTLFDPLGVLAAASAINQFRVHHGYHYPRSPNTIAEIIDARVRFIEEYREAIFGGNEHYYAIPHEGSLTAPDRFEEVCARFSLPLQRVRPDWIDFGFIDRCYRVDEQLYDPVRLREIILARIEALKIGFRQEALAAERAAEFDIAVYATYASANLALFNRAQLQVVEKTLIELPQALHGKSILVLDGPFTGFDPYRTADRAQFGSARHSVRWSSFCTDDPIPEPYRELLNRTEFRPVDFTNFAALRGHASRAVPLAAGARYLGSRFTNRLVEYLPEEDPRTLAIKRTSDRVYHVFSGKVIGACKAASLILRDLDSGNVVASV